MIKTDKEMNSMKEVGKKKMHKGYSGATKVPAVKVIQPGGMKKVVRPQGIHQRQPGKKVGDGKKMPSNVKGGLRVPNLAGAHGVKVFHKGKQIYSSK